MTHSLSILSVLLLLSSSLAAQPAAEPKDAEYAMRWNGGEGGPRTAKKVLTALGKEAEESTDYKIRYFDFTPPKDAPKGFKAILRQRQSGEKYELTFKYRGDHPLSGWKCPLPSPDEKKEEVDVSVLAGGTTKKSYYYSCTLKGKNPIEPPQQLKAEAKSCSSRMLRLKAGKLKVEEWHLPGGVTLVEVSRSDANTQDDLDSFRSKVVDKLVEEGVKPSDRSKTEMGSDCQ
jgi:hypothetical protein